MHSGLVGRMICILAAGLLCVSTAQGQVIEEGGFPVKGNGISGESFSLSCPSRLTVQAGESVLFSCIATGAPEEGVRYAWEAILGDGLHLLNGANERSPCRTIYGGDNDDYKQTYAYTLTLSAAGIDDVTEDVTVEVVRFDWTDFRGI